MVTASLELALSPSCPASLPQPAASLNGSSTIHTGYESNSGSGIAQVVRHGLTAAPKHLPPWLFYDEAGSILFDQITELPEYYLTRIEREIFARDAAEMIALAAGNCRLHLVELGAGSADKTRVLLSTAAEFQGTVCYEPLDVSATALAAARERLEREHPDVKVMPRVADYTREFKLNPRLPGETRLLLFIGSSIGNFLPSDALQLLSTLRDALEPGDSLLLGIDLAPCPEPSPESGPGSKTETLLIAAYDDAQGVTARFNKNILARLNRELGADFDPDSFRHRIRWNPVHSRIEMHLESLAAQRVRIPALDLEIAFDQGETIHTENSYKFRLAEVEDLLATAGFVSPQRWRDEAGWFAVYLATRA